MSAARKLRKLRDRRLKQEAMERGKTRKDALHAPNPSGSKLLKQFYRAKHGARPTGDKETTPLQEARAWYANLQQPKFRAGESAKRITQIEARR